MKHLGTLSLETERLILRRFELSDALAMFRNWANDPEVAKFVTWQAHGSIDVSRKIIKTWVDLYKHLDFYQWAIVLKEIGEPIGSISILKNKEQKFILGYAIGKAWWNKGITTEAGNEVLSFIFNEVGFETLHAYHQPENINSGKVMKKCGFSFKGYIKDAGMDNTGKPCDYAEYLITKKEFIKI